jgi:hypothetical protein
MFPAFDIAPLLRTLLSRLVSMALRCGMTYQAFNRLLRQVYFEVGSEFEPVRGKANSDGRISLLTGLSRRDVRALREQADAPPPVVPTIEWLVFDRWCSDLALLDDQGNVLPLPRTVRQGGERSFEALVASVSKEVWPRALLDEWLRKGNVVLDDQDRVVLQQRSHGAGLGSAAGSTLAFNHLAQDLMAGFEKRYLRDTALEGFAFPVVYGHHLTEASVKALYADAHAAAMEQIFKVNREVVEREARDAGALDATRRFTFGVVLYQADEREEPGHFLPAGQKSRTADKT